MRVERAIFIKDVGGLHASLAAKLVQKAQQYNVDFTLYYKDIAVDMKSILGLMSLAIPEGGSVTVVAEGENSEQSLQDLINEIE